MIEAKVQGETADTIVTVENPYLLSEKKLRLDRFIGGVALCISAPLERIASRYLTSVLDEGDRFFTQQRNVFDDNFLEVRKLRTMFNRMHDNEPSELTRNHPRIPSRGARVIRELRIDELPQVRSVLSGEMSLVGPRPVSRSFIELCEELLEPEKFQRWKQAKIAAKPGLTGLAQLGMITTQTVDESAINTFVDNDIAYTENANLGLDLEILAKTIPALFRAVSASRQEQPSLHTVADNL